MTFDRYENRRMILVVEGHEDVREALCALLRAEGYLVAQASSGEKALAVLGSFASVGLILLAWKLPGVSGAEVVAELRRRPDLARIPIIALTTDEQEQPAGVDGYVRKPFLTARVLALAHHYCGSPSGMDGDTGGATA
jgi:two-component system phosphate regulon response regulator PhoB